MKNISIVWDFDKTLAPEDSTTKVVEIITEGRHGEFWDLIKTITEKKQKPEWEDLLGSDAPAWMYSLSREASKKKIPLNSEFFKIAVKEISLFPNVIKFLKAVKGIDGRKDFKKLDIKIHHFVVSAGLQHLIELVFPEGLITHTFGCRYMVVADKEHDNEPESIPVFCMDETMKTRALFEISKGSFIHSDRGVNKFVPEKDRFSPFKNFIYIGDGPTDIPSLSLTRYNGGMGVVVYNPENQDEKKLKKMSVDKRADLITPADYSLSGELYKFIEARCIQIKQRYEAESL